MNFLKLTIVENKLKIIFKLRFSRTFRQLKFYINFINWLRDYFHFYVDISASLQQRKIEFQRHKFNANNVRRIFVNKTRIDRFIEKKLTFFKAIQKILFKSFYLIHTNSNRQFYIDLNVNKKFDINAMFYYIKKKHVVEIDKFSSRHVIELVLFLNRLITNVETRYWSTKLKIVDIVWMLKKTRHIVKIFINIIIIYINHNVVLKIISQTTLFITFTNKLNFRLIRASNYIQRFNFEIRHKFDKQHVVSNVLFRLFNVNVNTSIEKFVDENELNVLFIVFLMKMNQKFKNRILIDYKTDFNWQRIFVTLNVEIKNNENVAKLFFKKKTISFFARMILLLKITFTNFVDFVFFISSFKTCCSWRMTRLIISITLNVMNKSLFFDTFATCLVICEIICNIVRNVKRIKQKNTFRTNFFNLFWFHQCRFIRLRWILF